jgi:hypothetical protein
MRSAPTTLTRLGAAALATGATLGLVAGAAGAATSSGVATAAAATNTGNSDSSATPNTLTGIKAKAASDITDRFNALNAAIARVNAAKGLGSGQGTITAYLGTDIGPLQQLNQRIQSDATIKQAEQDFSTIFSNYRVFRLVLPAARIAGDADRATNTAIPELTEFSTWAQAQVNPRNQTVLQPLINDLNGQISTAANASNSLAGAVLAFTPEQWDANNSLLSPATSSDQATDTALKKGWVDVQQIRLVLRDPVAGAPR